MATSPSWVAVGYLHRGGCEALWGTLVKGIKGMLPEATLLGFRPQLCPVQQVVQIVTL